MTKNQLRLVRLFFALISLAMMAITVHTSLESNLFVIFPRMLRDPWTLATLIDFYFNVLVFSAWVIYREHRWVRSALWIVAFIGLGSIATSGYVFAQLLAMRPGDSFSKILARKNRA
jgi:hypothetical protein